jgi:hypothetical protein
MIIRHLRKSAEESDFELRKIQKIQILQAIKN